MKKWGFEHKTTKPLNPGEKFGRLTVESFCEFRYVGIKKPQRKAFYNCICDCGNKIVVNRCRLVTNNTRSCGCLHKENLIEFNKSRVGKPSGNRKPDGIASFNQLYNSYRSGSRTRGYSFNLDKEQFKRLTSKNCFYCNESPSQIYTHNIGTNKHPTPYIYNGLDRVNNNSGYTIENVVPCCGKCNVAKHTLSQDEFLELVRKIYANFKYEA